MDSSNRSTQIRAGIFLFIGLFAICSLVLYFGRFSQWSQHYYPITVEYTNANGLLKGADVLLAGARIGDVEKAPVVLPDMQGVAVVLRIDANVKIPKESTIAIGSSGLLGDRFVTVTIKQDADLNDVMAPGAVVKGLRESNIADLQAQIGEIVPKIDQVVSNINAVTERLNKDLFNKKGIAELQESLANIHQTTAVFAKSSEQIGNIFNQASLFLSKGTATMDSAKDATDDLKAFIENLRHHGIIFYRDTAKQPSNKQVTEQ
jgi:phospholipid/cholesterol/gamma-HCH transport system substrate-binding protein